MDWQTIITSITTSTVITAGIIYLLKRSFDKTLELQIEKLKEQNKAEIQEIKRRESLLYDEQFTNLKLILSLVYRLRNTTREILLRIEREDFRELDELERNIHIYGNNLRELLYAERAILPESMFGLGHFISREMSRIQSELRNLVEGRQKNKEQAHSKFQQSYERLDETYQKLTKAIHTYIGTESSKEV